MEAKLTEAERQYALRFISSADALGRRPRKENGFNRRLLQGLTEWFTRQLWRLERPGKPSPKPSPVPS